MKLSQHPQYREYMWDRKTDRRYRKALNDWKASRKPLTHPDDPSQVWTFERAQLFARQLAEMVQEYNRVLWTQFPYCAQCGGKCCEKYDVGVSETDSLILALLGLPSPVLPQEIEATDQDCIYRTASGCAWPAEWKSPICWTFYCLGKPPLVGKRVDGRYDDIASAAYQEVGDALTLVLLDLLPDTLWPARDELAAESDPQDLANLFGDVLFDVFLLPFNERYRIIDE